MRRPLLFFIALMLVGCQASEPSRSPASSVVVSSEGPTADSSPSSEPAASPDSPFAGEYFEDDVTADAIAAFVADLGALYREPDAAAVTRTFTADGLESAMRIDQRLRGAVDGSTSFLGDLTVRGLGTIREEPQSMPPLLESNVSIAVAAGAVLVDRATGHELQRWSDRQIFNLRVVLEYLVDDGRWIATSVGPPSEADFGSTPRPLPPAERCPGVAPDRRDSVDVDGSSTWCFGGDDGTLATRQQILVVAGYPCGESRASITTVGWPIGTAIDDWAGYSYVRDPDGRFAREDRLPIAYRPDTRLPDDAYSTALTDGEFELWVSPTMGDRAIYAQRTTRVERWPRVRDPWLVIDCN